MITFACKALVALSLAANAVLAFALWRPDAQPSPQALAVVAQDTPHLDAPPAPSSEADILAAARFGRIPAMGDPHALAEKMLREGYPSEVVSAVIVPMLSEWRGTEAINQAARKGSALARRLKAMLSDGEAKQKYLHDLLPHMRERAEEDLARERSIRFGHLTMEKILAIERVEEEFAFKPNQRSSYNQANATAQANIEGKIDKALRGTLTPEELREYWRFNSLLAYQLQKRVSYIDIDETTYDRLLAVAKRQENIFFQQPLGDFRGIVSDSQFVQLITRGVNDSRYRPADNLYRAAGLSEAQRGEFLRADRGRLGRSFADSLAGDCSERPQPDSHRVGRFAGNCGRIRKLPAGQNAQRGGAAQVDSLPQARFIPSVTAASPSAAASRPGGTG